MLHDREWGHSLNMAPKLAHKGSNLCRAPVAQSVPQGEGVERGWAA